MPEAKLPCEPGCHTGFSGDSCSTMHAAPFGIVEMVADDLDRPEALAQRVGDESAAAVPSLAVAHQCQPDIFAERGRIAGGGEVADRTVRIGLVQLLHNMRAAIERPVVERDYADKLEAARCHQALA